MRRLMPWTCPRCYGAGVILKHQHIRGGVCFRCDGRGRVLVPRSSLFTDDDTEEQTA